MKQAARNAEANGGIRSLRGRNATLVALAAFVVLVLAWAVLAYQVLKWSPGEDSAEAGFARDMMVHHAQAVEMAEILRDKTESEEMRIFATDVALTQQAQLGQMEGWLAVWGLLPTGAEPPMAWMGEPVADGARMPGMASPEQLEDLRKASPKEADELFLRLMIPHHAGSHPMAEAVLAQTERPEVERLASAIASSQRGEIETMQRMLAERGLPPVREMPDHHHGAGQPEGTGVEGREFAAGLAHGATQGASAFLAGLAAFVALVWLPAARATGAGEDAAEFFCRWMWGLFALLLAAGAVEVSLYAVQASGEPLSLALLWQALSETRVGDAWLARIGLGTLAVAAATWAAGAPGRLPFWWLSAALGGAMLATLTRLSHAASEGGILPFLADWTHVVAASLWMGGLLGFVLALLWPVRRVPAEMRPKLRRRAVRRFSRAATLAVACLVATGLYAALLHVPSIQALLTTPYGLALILKLGLFASLLALGAANFFLGGRGPSGRLVAAELVLALCIFAATGMLTSLPPADAAIP